MNEANGRAGIRPVHVVLGLIGLGVLVLFVGFILLVTATRFAFGPAEDNIVIRALPAVPDDAPAADEYQPFFAPQGDGENSFQLFDDPEVVPESVEFIGIAFGQTSDREFYTFKSRMGDELMSCTGEFSNSGGSWGCGDVPFLEPSIGGGASQSGNGPLIEHASVEGLGSEAVWARFEFSSGFAILSDVRRGVTGVEWVDAGDPLVTVTSYTEDLEELWSGDANRGR